MCTHRGFGFLLDEAFLQRNALISNSMDESMEFFTISLFSGSETNKKMKPPDTISSMAPMEDGQSDLMLAVV